jgi:murein DD-endopeptidase MepM/ murein hydrolase activator NlpD
VIHDAHVRAIVAGSAIVIAIASAITLVLWLRFDDEPTASPGSGVPACDGFDFPVGPPDGAGYYDAQPFGTNTHLGNDWNGNGGGNTDLGDPVHAVATGVVVHAFDLGGGWGNVVRIVHACGVESLYAHLDRIETTLGATVERGQRIGTIGTAHGRYLAHLHLEIRSPGLPLGGGYSTDTTGYRDPTAFIRANRPTARP